MADIQKITPFLWFDNNAEEAAKLYTEIFKNSKLISANPMMVNFELEGIGFMALNGGPHHKFTEAISFFVRCKNQEEVDYFWDKFIKGGGEVSQCGWLTDKFGISWQIIPDILNEYLSDPDQGRSDRVMQAMLKMQKIDIAKLKEAYDGK